MAAVDTHCPYCALQCAMTLEAGPDGVTVRARDFPTNRGGLCQKGWTAAELLTAPDRLTTPLVRRGSGELVPTSWDEALDIAASGFLAVQRDSGPDAVAVFGGGGLTNEKAYSLGKFARAVLGTRHIDYNGRFCMSAAATAGNRAFGIDRGLPFPVTDVGRAEAVLLVGSNPAETMPPFVQHLARARATGGLVVVDPRRTATAALTEESRGLHLQPVPGTDLPLLLGLLHLVVAEGLADEVYLADRTTGWDDVRRSVSAWWPARVAATTGVAEDRLRDAARLLGEAAPHRGGRGAIVLTGRGAEQHVDGTATVTAALNLALALGLPGRDASGYGCLTGQGNGQGGREHGQKADQLPGYRSIEDPAARAHVAGVWGVPPESLPRSGVPAVELLGKCGEEVRALLVCGSNPVVSAPQATAVRRRLRALELLVVCDIVPSETALLADVVLPVTQWAEEDGTTTSLEGRVLRRHAVQAPAGEARSELDILADLTGRLGASVTMEREARAVFDELARASAGGRADYSGLSHARLDAGKPLHWPVAPESAPRLFQERFAHADGRARMVAVDADGGGERPTADAPLHLVTGRVLAQYQSGAQTRRVGALNRSASGPFVEMHPRLAALLDVEPGEPVRVTSARGSATAPARVTRHIRSDTVFVPFHWPGEGLANAMTSDATDPESGMPAFKVSAVSVERVDVEPGAVG